MHPSCLQSPEAPRRAPLLPTMLHLFLLTIAIAIAIAPARASRTTPDPVAPVTFKPYDVSTITLYGDNALFRPNLCPGNLTFTDRARFLPELADNFVGIFPTDIQADGVACKADALMLKFTPIGRPSHLPPQWVFEDSLLTKHPVNFTCGDTRFSIRYGYFNDVSTPNGFLDPTVVYLDFAVIPNTNPFAFCAYATSRQDGRKPIDYAPFPTRKTWKTVRDRDAGRPVKAAAPAAPSPELEIVGSPEMDADEEDEEEVERSTLSSSKAFTPVGTSLLAQFLHRARSTW